MAPGFRGLVQSQLAPVQEYGERMWWSCAAHFMVPRNSITEEGAGDQIYHSVSDLLDNTDIPRNVLS